MKTELVLKSQLAKGLKSFRHARHFSQKDIHEFLNISQAQYSKIENGYASLTAEQLIRVLGKFNISLEDLLPFMGNSSNQDELVLQNTLVRLGANHLRESPIVLPLQTSNLNDLVVQILFTHPSSRLVTALTPAIIKNIEQLNFNQIFEKLSQYKIEKRFIWLLDASERALKSRLDEKNIHKEQRTIYQRAQQLLERKKEEFSLLVSHVSLDDELDRDLFNRKTFRAVKEKSDGLAQRWKIVTRIKQVDFFQALTESER